MNNLTKKNSVRNYLVLFLVSLCFSANYALSQESWTPTSIVNAFPRQAHSTIWTGTKMIVWGGNGANLDSRTGGIYDPLTNTWTIADSANSPSIRNLPTAVWTGSKMIVWGGQDYNGNSLNTGGIYDPLTNIWTSVSLTNAPPARCFHTTVWTGSKMIVWGGYWGLAYNTGYLYEPTTNTWTPTSTVNAPEERFYHIALWAGTKMIVWGGGHGMVFLNTGGIYDTLTNSWTEMSVNNAPSGRWDPTAVWTGTKMIVWGGQIDVLSGCTKSGGIYDPLTNTWDSMDSTGAPAARTKCTSVWTGTRMIVWGGSSTGYHNTGGIYNPATNTWTATTTVNAPSARQRHGMVWTGTKMIVWGGGTSFAFNNGGIYQNTSIGISKIENSIPTEFSLFQNYPNPFNPSTNIRYDLPKNVFVKLVVYDELGREIETLVNEKLSAGTYEVTFDGSNLPSGIYFYKLIADGFSETKRMVFIK